MVTLSDLWSNRYSIEHRRFHVRTRDGERIAGVHVDRHRNESLVLYVHGFMANKNHMRVPAFVQSLARHQDVMAVDLRGHGESSGGCTMGALEVYDIEATVRHARSLGYSRIITVGSSMGGASVIRHAGLFRSQDGVVTIGAFADVAAIGRPNADVGLQILYNSGRLGELWSYVTRGTRLDQMHDHEAPHELVDRIAPIPLLIIHGEWDNTVHPRNAHLLYEAAGEPKELVVVPRGGHDAPHLTEATVTLIQEWLLRHDLAEPVA